MSITDEPSREVFIVDDDPSSRDLLALQFEQAGFTPIPFADRASVVDAARATTPACIIVDLYMPGGSGFDVLDQLDARHYPAPIFVNSGRGDIPCAVEAIKRGACDFFEKSHGHGVLIARVSEALKAWRRLRPNGGATNHDFPGSATLTPREREVLGQIVACSSNKESAAKLGISQRTVEIHRAHIMHKLGAKNAVELIRIVLANGHAAALQEAASRMADSARTPDSVPVASSANGSRANGFESASNPMPNRSSAAISK
jgi:two-component system response regulator FixJ